MKHRWAFTVLFLPFACSDATGPSDATPTAPVAEVDDSPFAEPGTVISEEISVTVDVRPSTEVNPIILHSGGVVPVALLAEPGFDPSEIDPESLAFGPPSGPFVAPLHDLTAECALEDHLQDVDDDGDLDLVTHYSIGDLGFEVGDTEGCLTGSLLSGPSLVGCDAVDVRL
jgi:hypothetical protein